MGELICLESSPTPIKWEEVDSAIHNPMDLWNIVLNLLKEVVLKIREERKGNIECIGISSFGESGVLIDNKGNPLGPVLTWFDIRTKDIFERFKNLIKIENLRFFTGLFSDYTYTLFKLLWLKEFYPSIFIKNPKWLSIADWIAYNLTGNIQVGITHANRTGCIKLVYQIAYRFIRQKL
jgi:xylulokinase